MIERTELLARVASMYYEDSVTQDEIARRIDTSRSTVSRMLQEALDSGLVEIIVHYPWKTVPLLQADLASRFDLRESRVLLGRNRGPEEIIRGLGVLAARYLDSLVAKDTILGISWGKAVHSTVRALRPAMKLPITVVQIVGSVGGGDPLTDGHELARVLAGVYGGEYRYLHAPLIVEDARTREALMRERRIVETLTLARRAHVALVGIGAPSPRASSLLRAGYLNREVLTHMRAQGAVGNVCARHFDAQGRVLDIELNQRVVGIDLEALHSIDHVIGVAAGKAKAAAILGALRGGHVNVLVTDDETARTVLGQA